ncbi:hypothetical protein RFI_08497 [Reticulomyxa filosa]|uniref:Uncharacterized protein n=1 Tax=Reticulomyxa filosa TaxID=46433 RepID=X6NSB5_RETFI|nr:hypothetical protein RFI_08497 [Reticulomyxa filosa]|eukprot:ETO28634.1 hypothetical protein RFI_08497 [Reticulomyxa filosa]
MSKRKSHLKRWHVVQRPTFKVWQPFGQKSRRKFKKRTGGSAQNIPLIEDEGVFVVPSYDKFCNPLTAYNSKLKKKKFKISLFFFFKQLIKNLNGASHFQKQSFFAIEFLNDVMISQRGSKKSRDPISIDMICYGIGSFSKNSDSLQQLSLFSAIRDYYKSFEAKREELGTGNNETEQQTNTVRYSPYNKTFHYYIYIYIYMYIMKDDTKMEEKGPNEITQNEATQNKAAQNEATQDSKKYVFSWERKHQEKKRFEKWDKYPFILNKVELFEPLLNVIEKNLLKNVLKVSLLDKNDEGNYKVNNDGYVVSSDGNEDNNNNNNNNNTDANANPNPNPNDDDSNPNEIDTPLYNNLLHTNWDKDKLSRMIIVGNSFSQYGHIALNLNEREKGDMNYILTSTKLNLISEKSLDHWIIPKHKFQKTNETPESLLEVNTDEASANIDVANASKKMSKKQRPKKYTRQDILYLDMYQQKQLAVTKNAFAFQHVQYYPVPQLMKIADPAWSNIARELERMHVSTNAADKGDSKSQDESTLTNVNSNDQEMIERNAKTKQQKKVNSKASKSQPKNEDVDMS